jgi:hypothetical protein
MDRIVRQATVCQRMATEGFVIRVAKHEKQTHGKAHDNDSLVLRNVSEREMVVVGIHPRRGDDGRLWPIGSDYCSLAHWLRRFFLPNTINYAGTNTTRR